MLNPDIDIQVYSKIMNEFRVEETALEEQLANATKDTSTLSYKLDEVLARLSTLKKSFHDLDLTRKQLFLKVVLSGYGMYNGRNWTTAGIHPLFADKALKLKELGILEINKASVKDAIFEEGIVGQTYGQMLEELAAAVA